MLVSGQNGFLPSSSYVSFCVSYGLSDATVPLCFRCASGYVLSVDKRSCFKAD